MWAYLGDHPEIVMPDYGHIARELHEGNDNLDELHTGPIYPFPLKSGLFLHTGDVWCDGFPERVASLSKDDLLIQAVRDPLPHAISSPLSIICAITL
jgi:hypothetical protein